MERKFDDGGTLTVEYEGEKDGTAVFSADKNEGIDRSLDVTFKAMNLEEQRTVIQQGMREVFTGSDGDWLLSDGGTFNVLKNGL